MPRFDGRSLLGSWNFHFSAPVVASSAWMAPYGDARYIVLPMTSGNGFVFPQAAGVAGGLEMKAPDLLQRRDILRRDLVERAVAVGALRVVGARPVGRAGCTLRAAHGGEGRRNGHPKASLEANPAIVLLPSLGPGPHTGHLASCCMRLSVPQSGNPV